MKKLHFDYRMDIQYSSPVELCYFTIRCFPRTDARQKPENIRMKLVPECTWNRSWDGFGNTDIYGKVDTRHDFFSFRISGDVTIGQIPYEEEADEHQVSLFRVHHGLTQPGAGLKGYFSGLSLSENQSSYEKACRIMHCLHTDFIYRPGVTEIQTTAEEAWNLRQGVCQDYAHIFISLCRMAGIPARYVTGMISGEGASHAWAEILYHGKWIGMDPTHDILMPDTYIKISHGRDAGDCPINRGIVLGGGKQTQKISVCVTEI